MENNVMNLLYVKDGSISSELCNDMINLFEQSDGRYDGLTAGGLNKHTKDTTDFIITQGGTRWDKFNKLLSKELNNNVKEYVTKFNKQVNDTYRIFGTSYLTTDAMQLQKYNKNIGKYIYHNDYICDWKNKRMRQLTFIWYLNDVEEGGETEFWSKYRIKPKAGKLVLFPASWTFPHRANIPISNDKYIITGWLWEQYDK
jgi:hypothetical protein